MKKKYIKKAKKNFRAVIVQNRKKLIAGTGMLLLVFLAIVLYLPLNPAKPVIGFYNIPEISRQAITTLAQDSTVAGTTQFKFRLLDETKPIRAQLTKRPKVSLLFIQDGKTAEDLSVTAIAPSEAILRLMPQAMRQAGQATGKTYGLPLQLDHFEIAYNRLAFRQSRLSEPKTFGEFLVAAEKIKKPAKWPLLCAGAQDADLLMLVGSLTEALYGMPAWDELTTQLKDSRSIKEILSDGPLRKTLDELVKWRSTGLIHPEWFRMKDADVSGFMENGYVGIVFMPLSTHRRIPQATIDKFASIPFPAAQANRARAITAPVTLGMLIGRKKAEQNSEAFLENLARASGQNKLAGLTGLAPVNSTAETRDRQAADVRLWAAASQKPLPEIGTAAFGDAGKKSAFAQEIRLYLEMDGAGY